MVDVLGVSRGFVCVPEELSASSDSDLVGVVRCGTEVVTEIGDDSDSMRCVSACVMCDHADKNGPFGAASGPLGGTDLVSASVTVADVSGVDCATVATTLLCHIVDSLNVEVVC